MGSPHPARAPATPGRGYKGGAKSAAPAAVPFCPPPLTPLRQACTGARGRAARVGWGIWKTAASFNHLISPRKQRGRDFNPDGARGFQVNDESERKRLLDRKLAGFGAVKNFIHITGAAAKQVRHARAVGHQPAVDDIAPEHE